MMVEYDYIILGGGGAGLNCALELADSGKSILILEKEKKDSDDRTWSYWEKGSGKFDHLVSHTWNKIHFYGHSAQENVPINPYKYKMIRSGDFYRYADETLAKHPHVDRQLALVGEIVEKDKYVEVHTQAGIFKAKQVLDSISIPSINKDKHQYVAQHFGGWFVECEEDVFDSDVANLMDFRVPQENETRFFYVLPNSKRTALIEIAIFSNEILDQDAYDQHIQDYITKFMNIGSFKITEKEYGVIPMTAYPFHKQSTDKVIKIGTAGGWVKPSSGYAFKRIVERSELLAKQLLSGESISVSSSFWHRWLDKTMLTAWNKQLIGGKDVFDSLFSKRAPSEVFEFLDEKSSLIRELKVMYSCPIIPMTKAAFL